MEEKTNKRSEEIREELKGLSPFLSEMQFKKEPFKVPEYYFDSMQLEVLQKIRTEQASSQSNEKASNGFLGSLLNQLSAILQARMALTLASLMILAVASWFLFDGVTQEINTEVNLSELSTQEINEYIETNISDFENQDIIQSLAEVEELSIIPEENVSNGELDHYLDDVIDDIDPQDLEELF